jgi:hypothetical protein
LERELQKKIKATLAESQTFEADTVLLYLSIDLSIFVYLHLCSAGAQHSGAGAAEDPEGDVAAAATGRERAIPGAFAEAPQGATQLIIA